MYLMPQKFPVFVLVFYLVIKKYLYLVLYQCMSQPWSTLKEIRFVATYRLVMTALSFTVHPIGIILLVSELLHETLHFVKLLIGQTYNVPVYKMAEDEKVIKNLRKMYGKYISQHLNLTEKDSVGIYIVSKLLFRG